MSHLALEVARKFVGAPDGGEYAGEQEGTTYADGGSDTDYYFDFDGIHVVVSYSYVDDSYSARRSDRVVW